MVNFPIMFNLPTASQNFSLACSLFVRVLIYFGLICLDINSSKLIKYGRWSDILLIIIPAVAVFVVAESLQYRPLFDR